ncbi:thrombopoietin isoform X2 [Cynoglossus semilaevis]|uniref:thrombopoietin isoform X2 n=1 Tax=Cynoglossus semilaevis TaxID=244447 RepID=UPI000D626E1D|nr:uncharacterized protein LOC103396086 isoform X2 [Cynoglossus semilaevis]
MYFPLLNDKVGNQVVKGATVPLYKTALWTQGINKTLNGPNVDSSGAAKQGMALSSPGLLLICMLASKVWDSGTKPIDFVCNRAARRVLNLVPEMEKLLNDCSDVITTSFQLPCTELNVASWETKSLQVRRGDIVASLMLLQDGVKVMRALSQPECGASLLQRLENNIRNYLYILTSLQLSGPAMNPTLSCVPQLSQSLNTFPG